MLSANDFFSYLFLENFFFRIKISYLSNVTRFCLFFFFLTLHQIKQIDHDDQVILHSTFEFFLFENQIFP